MKKILLSFIILMMITLSSCSNNKEVNNGVKDDFEVQIVTSLAPIASIAQFIGGDTLGVHSIIEPGFSPHTFDLKPSHLKQINNTNLLLTTGLSIDNFLEDISISTKTLLLKDHLSLLEGEEHNHNHADEEHEADEHNDSHEEDNHDAHTEHEEQENEHHNNESEEEHAQHIEHSETESLYYDSHVWLSLENGEKIAKLIKDELIKIKPENKNIYEDNFISFQTKSLEIKNNFQDKIKNKKQSNFIIFHDAYNYLFNEFNIDHDNILILSETAGREPSVSEMKEIIDSISKNNIKILFKEPQLDTKLIQTLSSEYNLEILVLDPLGNSIDKNNYFDTIEANLNNLSKTYE